MHLLLLLPPPPSSSSSPHSIMLRPLLPACNCCTTTTPAPSTLSPLKCSSRWAIIHRNDHSYRPTGLHSSCKLPFPVTTGKCTLASSQVSSTRRNLYTPRGSTSSSSPDRERIAIVWFKKDLRVDDHPGLLNSTAYNFVVPVYIFDPEILGGCSSHLLQALLEAVTDLKSALQSLGSDLIIRSGSTKDELLGLARKVGATDIIAEQEVEHEWCELVSSISSTLQMGPLCGQVLDIKSWRASLYEVEDLPCSYREFQRMRCPLNPPLQAPPSLPHLPENLDRGLLPSITALEDVKCSLTTSFWQENSKRLQNDGAEGLLESEEGKVNGAGTVARSEARGMLKGFFDWRERYLLASPYEALEKRKRELVMQLDKVERYGIRRVGASAAMVALDGYLRYLEPTWRDDWKQLHEQVMEAEATQGASFRLLFDSALTLGTISRRRVYHEALEYEKARNGGRSSPFGFSTFTAAAAVEDIKSIEWYQMLAVASGKEGKKRGWHVRTWRWRGFLVQYNTLGSDGPAIVLVHGFGAFWEHYRDNIKGLAEKGNRVWALTLLGFGRSEKPNILYTELLWAELIRDFIAEVVGEPAVLVGNSIGGYMVSIVAGLWPSIVKSLVLLNTAGAVVPDYLSLRYSKPRDKSQAAWAGARLILLYLRKVSCRLLKRCYPTKPWRADDWLCGEVMRASHDPGAAIVIESLFRLRRPLPINYFIDRYNNKVYVIQGIKDPLRRHTQRTRMLESHCKNVVVKLLDAGHCPHDEIPDEVNGLIIDWIQKFGFVRDELATESAIEKVGV